MGRRARKGWGEVGDWRSLGGRDGRRWERREEVREMGGGERDGRRWERWEEVGEMGGGGRDGRR